jgi:phosphoglycerate dehydrogenase-like enzyme
MPRVAILDDYQGVALEMANWSALPSDCQVQVFRDHLTDLAALAERLSHFEVVTCKDELFARSDILSIHVQLSARTRGLVGARELHLMKPTAYLINTARGPIVDEAALVQALQTRTIAGAGLDVFDQEPLPPGHPLTVLDNTLLVPHIGYVTREQYQVRYRDTVEDVAAYLRGESLRVLNPEALDTVRK